MGYDWFNKEVQTRRDFKEIFDSEAGQRVLMKLVKDYHVFKTSPTADPYLAQWQEGQRSVVVKMLELIDTDLRTLRQRYDQQEMAKQKNKRK